MIKDIHNNNIIIPIEAETTTIYSIVNTLTELNEVNSVKILINGKENQSFKNSTIKFERLFTKED